jgi:hypothetical protein
MSIFYIPRKQEGDWQGAFDSLAAQVRELKTTHVIDDEKIKELMDKFRTHGVNFYDGLKTYSKDDLILFGDMAQQAFFYKSLQDGNTGHWPSAPESSSWWMMIAGDYISRFFGDVTGYTTDTVVSKVGGASAADIADVTAQIKSGQLDHPDALTIGEFSSIVNVGTGPNPKTINLGGAGDTVAIAGTLATIDTTNLQVADSLIRVNKGGTAGSGGDAGLEIEEDGAVAGYIKTNTARDGFLLKAPAAAELQLNQSVATGSSPNFQALTTTGHVQAGGYLRTQTFTNPIGEGSYLAHGSSTMPGASVFMNQPGSAAGGWRWIMYKPSNAWLSDAMSLTKEGALTVSGYVNSTGLFSNMGIAVNNWDNNMITNNYGFIGRNRAGATGRMSFGCHRGGGLGGFDWVSYNSTIGEEGTPMTLSREGNLAITGAMTTAKVTNAKQLLLEQTGDTYGPTRVRLQNRTDKNGMEINTSGSGHDICDLEYITRSGNMQTRFISSPTPDIDSANTGGELVYRQTTPGNIFAIGSHKVISVKPFTAKAGMTVNGDLSVTGGITGGFSTHTMTGSWSGGTTAMQSNIKLVKMGPMVTATFDGFSVPVNSSTVLFTYLAIPAAYRPTNASGARFVVQFTNGSSNRMGHLHIVDDGSIVLQSPNLTYDTSVNAILSGGTSVTWTV